MWKTNRQIFQTSSFGKLLYNDTNGDKKEDKQISITSIMKDIIISQKHEHEKEEREKDEGKRKIIVYQANEVEGSEPGDRKDKDKDTINKVLKAIKRDDIQMKTCFGLGKSDSGKSHKVKCTPIKIM